MGQASLDLKGFRILSGSEISVAAPTGARLRHLEIAAWRGATSVNGDPGFADAEHLSGLMLGENAGNVIIDDDDLIHFAKPLLRKHADRGRAAPYAHALFLLAINDRRFSRRNGDARALIDRERHFLAVAQIEKRFASHAAFAFRAAGEVMYSANRKHLRAILCGGDVPNGFALRADQTSLSPEMPVGVNFQFYAAVAEDPLGHNGDHVHAIDFGGNDKRCGLVVGICGASANRGDERLP